MSSSSSLPEADALLTEASEPILTESGGMLQIEASSSSSLTGNVFLDNVDLLRQYSLDPDLIELYFNKGVFVDEVNLDDGIVENSSSSSSSEAFSLSIEIERLVRDPFRGEYRTPEDLQTYIYDEKANGTPVTGLVVAEKTTGVNEVLVRLEGSQATEGDEVSFQINIEHPSISALKYRFKFKERRAYSFRIGARPAVLEESRRIDAAYSSYLLNWIQDFWAAYDADDVSLVPLFQPPTDSPYFFPLEHARWRLSEEISTASALSTKNELRLSAAPTLSPGNKELVEGWNFLGVSPSIWNCINTPNESGDSLAINVPKQTSESQNFDDWIGGDTGDLLTSDQDFNCRSFTAAAMFFLRSQIESVCPGSVVSAQSVANSRLRKSHAIIHVELPGSPEPCCTGSFFYEPQTGSTYDTLKDPESKNGYCDKFPEYCSDGTKDWVTRTPGKEYTDEGSSRFGNPDWEKAPSQVERIRGVVCGCLEGDHPEGTAEKAIKSKCDDGTFDAWFVESFAYEPERTESPMADMPQILSCDKVGCTEPAEEGASPCQEDPSGVEPYVCETRCREYWMCFFTCDPVWAALEELEENFYESESDCNAVCECPEGFQKIPIETPQFIKSLYFQCFPDCNLSPNTCEEQNGPGYCCVEDTSPHGTNSINHCVRCDGCCEPDPLSNNQICTDCADKTKTLRLWDQWPESGNSPFG